MTHNQLLILLILATTLGLFLWGYWRHDMVAVGALLACVVAGVLPKAEAFAGFSHPAVITVACVLVLSRALQRSGAIDVLAQRVLPAAAGPRVTIAALTGLGAVLSAFMNNVGALALLLPVAVQGAEKQALPSGTVLMPLAAGTILGGMTTLIGTPPNLIVSGFRAHTEAGSFAMFDFTPVGLAVAATGVLFVGLVGWRLVPARQQAGVGGFDIGGYLTEARVTKGSKAVGRTIREVEQSMDDSDAQIVGVVHNEFRVAAPNPGQTLQVGDLLVIEAEPKSLASALAKLGFKLEEDVGERPAEPGDDRAIPPAAKRRSGDRPSEQGQETGEKTKAGAEEFALIELAVRPDAALIGRSATDLHLRTRHGINLLALSRQGRRSVRRLRSQAIKAGDVLLMQGLPETVMEFASEFGCVPLARRSIRIPNRRRAVLATGILAAAIAGAAFGLLPAALSFAAGVLACMALRVMPLRAVYEAVDWPVIVLLAALLPVAGVMDSTGAADLLARCLQENLAQGNAILGLLIVLVLTMTLSDFMNNAATAAVMCPIAISTATELGVSPDSFLMAVAIGASCAFLTPIGHQNNTLILGPGGFRFGDYWKLGLPLELLVVAVSVPLLLVFWPLR